MMQIRFNDESKKKGKKEKDAKCVAVPLCSVIMY